jgi:hypothetical protein
MNKIGEWVDFFASDNHVEPDNWCNAEGIRPGKLKICVTFVTDSEALLS